MYVRVWCILNFNILSFSPFSWETLASVTQSGSLVMGVIVTSEPIVR